jgi:hypothetical protein
VGDRDSSGAVFVLDCGAGLGGWESGVQRVEGTGK